MKTPSRTFLAAAAGLLLASAPGLAAQQQDARECQDHPLIKRMPSHWIHHCPEKQFDAYAFTVGPNKKTETVEGQVWNYSYYPQASLKPVPSELPTQRNFENAITQQGGTLVYGEKSRQTFKLEQGGQEIWIEVTSDFTGKYGFAIVQKAAMEQDIVVDAAGLAKGLNATGHMVVAGILFDTGESTIKPESAAPISEVAKLLQSDPALEVFVVGHTDGVGSVGSNLTLSQARAEAVVQAHLRDHGVAAARLNSLGDAGVRALVPGRVPAALPGQADAHERRAALALPRSAQERGRTAGQGRARRRLAGRLGDPLGQPTDGPRGLARVLSAR